MKIEFLETIKVFDGKFANLNYHQNRYEQTLNSFGVEVLTQLKDLLSPPLKGLYRCRFVYDVDGKFTQSYHSYEKRTIKHLKLIQSDTIEYDRKYAEREKLNDLFAKREACDDILIVKNGLITDTTIANVAFFDGDLWVTPESPLLAGTTRQRLLDEGFLKEADISVESLNSFEKIAVMNAMIDFDIIADKKPEEIIC